MRHNRFTFLCTREERYLLAAVAQSLARTESDAVRCLIRAAAHELSCSRTTVLPDNERNGGDQLTNAGRVHGEIGQFHPD